MKIEFFRSNNKDDDRIDEGNTIVTVLTTIEPGDAVTVGDQFSAQFKASDLAFSKETLEEAQEEEPAPKKSRQRKSKKSAEEEAAENEGLHVEE